ncbi:MAG: DUF6338 family protein [Candidatus Omnitrophica bacterium]|nr:DUF6338 family protein [Candidatus Omnitrophota bacterium]MCF7897398.1 DUF6338 family protein [Candidatus Omnitrophota bacterium]MCF7909495.1 DUF6338 family protein [Candidatus Omnitrophota bacterium]
MANLNSIQLFYILICLLPGYIFEHVTREKVPYQKSKGLEYFLNLLWYSAVINILILILFSLALNIKPLFNFLEEFVILFSYKKDVLLLIKLLCVYSITAIVMAYLLAICFVRYISKKAKNKLPVFTRVINEVPPDKIIFLKVTLKNSKSYTGQLFYYPNEHSILASGKFYIYLAEVYELFVNDNWKKLKSDGLLINSSEITAIEVKA